MPSCTLQPMLRFFMFLFQFCALIGQTALVFWRILGFWACPCPHCICQAHIPIAVAFIGWGGWCKILWQWLSPSLISSNTIISSVDELHNFLSSSLLGMKQRNSPSVEEACLVPIGVQFLHLTNNRWPHHPNQTLQRLSGYHKLYLITVPSICHCHGFLPTWSSLMSNLGHLRSHEEFSSLAMPPWPSHSKHFHHNFRVLWLVWGRWWVIQRWLSGAKRRILIFYCCHCCVHYHCVTSIEQ